MVYVVVVGAHCSVVVWCGEMVAECGLVAWWSGVPVDTRLTVSQRRRTTGQ